MLIPSKVTKGFEVERRKDIKMHKSQESARRPFLCLFDVQLQTLVTFEGINIF